MNYETKCHGECEETKANFCFTPGQLKRAYPICRKCAKAGNQRRWIPNNVPANIRFNESSFESGPSKRVIA